MTSLPLNAPAMTPMTHSTPHSRRLIRIRLIVLLAAACCAAALAIWASPRPAPAQRIERLRGIYLQRAIELATVDDRLIRLTRMTKFRRCGTGRGMAEDYNDHIVEVLGVTVPGLGFVAGIVDAVEGCDRAAAGRS